MAAKTQLRGRDGVLEVIRQLQGIELPAPAWSSTCCLRGSRIAILRISRSLCLAGVIAWGRLRLNDDPQQSDDGGGILKQRRRKLLVPTRTAPIAFLLRDELEVFLEGSVPEWEEAAGPISQWPVGRYLAQRGASFLSDIARGTGY